MIHDDVLIMSTTTSSTPRTNKSLPPTCETLRVSTITAQGSISDKKENVCFRSFFENFPLVFNDAERTHLSYEMIKYTDRTRGYCQRGVHPKHAKPKCKRGKTDPVLGSTNSSAGCKIETLRNQVTVVQWIYDENISKLHHVSIKVFTNGRIHIAGLRKVEHGIMVIRKLIETIRDLGDKCGIVTDISRLHTDERNYDYSVIMINCDFKVPFMIKCRTLHQIVRSCGVKCHYEQDNKAGVKISYSVCVPDKPVKIVTIMVCRTGSVIMTGANDMDQLPIAHKFVKNLLYDHKKDIEHV